MIPGEQSFFHVTFVMHNTRISKRMVEWRINVDEPEYLEIHEEEKLIEICCKIIPEDKMKIFGINFCRDHLHMVINCDKHKLGGVVGKLKSKSARAFNIWRGMTIPEGTAGHAWKTVGYAPLSRGTTQHQFWARKFNRKEITSFHQFRNTIAYIENNRVKHQLPEFSMETKEIIKSILASM